MSEWQQYLKSLQFLNWGKKKQERTQRARVTNRQIVKAIKAHKGRVSITQVCNQLNLPAQGTYWMRVKRVALDHKLGRSIQRWKR
jgi:hypothetical protein